MTFVWDVGKIFFFTFIFKYIFLLTLFSIFEDSASHRNCKYEKLKKGFMLRVLFDIFYGSSSTYTRRASS